MSTSSTISVPETLNLLDSTFSSLAAGLSENGDSLWLGSGISFGRVDGFREIVSRAIEHLRARLTARGGTCAFWVVLQADLALAAPTDDEKSRFDCDVTFVSWPDAESLTVRRLLQTHVRGQVSDHLLWDAIDVSATFADPKIAPDVERLCIALLVLEGLASDIASANWDSLIDKATVHLRIPPRRWSSSPLRWR